MMKTPWMDRVAVLAPYLKSKNVYVYGTGRGGSDVYDALKASGVPVAGFIDGKTEGSGEFKGVRVAGPEMLDATPSATTAVLVASQTHGKAMAKQLEKRGYVKGIHFFHPLEGAYEPSADKKLSNATQKYEGDFTRIFRTRDPNRGVSVTLDENYTLYHGVLATRGLEGCLAEVGVFRGGTSRMICEAKGDAPLYLCDTFEGMPSIQNEHDPEGVWVKTHTTTSLEYVREYVGGYPNVHFVKGIFPDSVGHHPELEMEKKQFKFVNLDVDLYESTLQSLAWFWPRMVSGGWIVTHNYNLTYGKWGNTPGVKKSFKEFLKGESCRIVEIAETQALIVKP